MDEIFQRTPDVLPRCPKSGKLSFPSKYLPKKWRVAGKKGNVKRLYGYKCPDCPYFHETSHL